MRHTAARVGLVFLIGAAVSTAACDSGRETTGVTSPSVQPQPTSLSGRVLEVTSSGRTPMPGFGVVVVVVRTTSNGFSTDYLNATTAADGRYELSQLPAGWAVVHAQSGTHRQVCAATTVLGTSTQLDVEVTSKANPQSSNRPLVISGQIYETTPAGRVGVGVAGIEVNWANDGLLLGVVTDSKGRYSVCGVPANRSIAFEVFPPDWNTYSGSYTWHTFSGDGTLDIELKRN